MTNHKLNKEIEKAQMRLGNIIKKFGRSESSVSQHINLRTDRMTKVAKLRIWVDVLESFNYNFCAGYAYKKSLTV